MNISTIEAFEALRTFIKEDPSYAWSWHCNVAMAIQDEGGGYAESQRAAARFMYTCFEVDTLPLVTFNTNKDKI